MYLYKKKKTTFRLSSSVPPQGLDCATCSRQSYAHLVYTLPTSLRGRRFQGSRPSGHKKREELLFFSSVPPQVVPVNLCVPGQPDFRTLVWLWSSKNVASQNQRESAMISRYKYRNFALKYQITTHHFHRSLDAQNHRYHNRQLTHPPNLPGCHYRVCGIDLCRRRYNPNPHRSKTMGIGAI